MTQIADSLYDNNVNSMWSQINRMCSSKCVTPTCIDKAHGSNIAKVFKDKYSLLYNSVPSSKCDIEQIENEIKEHLRSRCLS